MTIIYVDRPLSECSDLLTYAYPNIKQVELMTNRDRCNALHNPRVYAESYFIKLLQKKRDFIQSHHSNIYIIHNRPIDDIMDADELFKQYNIIPSNHFYVVVNRCNIDRDATLIKC